MKFPERYRHSAAPFITRPGEPYGWFVFPPSQLLPSGLKVMACDGQETAWEHCSVSHLTNTRPPTWEEMCIVKDLFWSEDEWVVQFHPAKSEYINDHPGVLHLWRPTTAAMPKPPKILV